MIADFDRLCLEQANLLALTPQYNSGWQLSFTCLVKTCSDSDNIVFLSHLPIISCSRDLSEIGAFGGFLFVFHHMLPGHGYVRRMAIALVSHPNCCGLIFSYGFGTSFSNVSGLASVLETKLPSYAGCADLQTKSPYYCNSPCRFYMWLAYRLIYR